MSPTVETTAAVLRSMAPLPSPPSAVCTRIALEGLNLPVTLRGGAAYVTHGGVDIELGSFLGQAASCADTATQSKRTQLLRIYQTALTAGVIARLSRDARSKVTLHYLSTVR